MSRIPSREEALFADALARPPARRRAFLAAACGGNVELLAHLVALVSAHEASESLVSPIPPKTTSLAEPSAMVLAGKLTRYEREVLLAGIEKELAALPPSAARQ